MTKPITDKQLKKIEAGFEDITNGTWDDALLFKTQTILDMITRIKIAEADLVIQKRFSEKLQEELIAKTGNIARLAP